MTIVVVANHKGGVGKTSLAAHLLFRAAELGGSALGVDLDAQANLTATLVSRDATLQHPGTAALFAEAEVAGAAPMSAETRMVDILPANDALTDVDKASVTALFSARSRIQELGSKYDLVVIDTAPALGLRLSVALASADCVVVPLVPETYSLQGLATLLSEASVVRANLNQRLGEPVHVWNLVNPQSTSHASTIAEMGSVFSDVLGPLHRHIAVTDALSTRRPVWVRASNRKAADEWRACCDSILARAHFAPSSAPAGVGCP